MRDQIIEHLKEKLQFYVGNRKINENSLEESEYKVWERKRNTLKSRGAEILKCNANGKILDQSKANDEVHVQYEVRLQFLIKQSDRLYIEEAIEQRKAVLQGDKIIKDELPDKPLEPDGLETPNRYYEEEERLSFEYNRLAAVQYAERWWNSFNPKFKKFENDCTNYISQCLHAGGAPMTGYPNKTKGWWMANNNWSYSWTTANALRWHLSGSKSGLRAKEVSGPDQLMLGDVICYDFQGDGRFDHNTIVVAKDAKNMPLVNAHTYNSRMRYWAYEDSTAYTPNIQYKFFHILNSD